MFGCGCDVELVAEVGEDFGVGSDVEEKEIDGGCYRESARYAVNCQNILILLRQEFWEFLQGNRYFSCGLSRRKAVLDP